MVEVIVAPTESAAGLEQRGVARHHDLFSDGAGLEREVDQVAAAEC